MWWNLAGRRLHRWHPCRCKKRDACVSNTRGGAATKIMGIVDQNGLPVAVLIAEGSKHESQLVEATLAARFTKQKPDFLVGDKAYDSTKLDRCLGKKHIHLVAPLKEWKDAKKPNPNRRKQDGRHYRRYKRRWKIEHLWARLLRDRRISTRYEHKAENYLAFIHIACGMILAKTLQNYL